MTRRLRWGVLGASGIARSAVIPAVEASRNGTLAAVASRDPKTAMELFDAGKPIRFPTYDALLADPEIDAVYIPLPNNLHAEWTIRAAEAGKAVLCEKPLAMDADEAARVVSRCKQLGVPLMEGFMYRSHPQHKRVRELIAQGVIGQVAEVRAHLCVDIMSPADPKNIRFAMESGGGSLMDMGCYTVGVCRMIFGAEPNRVMAHWQIDPAFGVDISAGGVLEFSGGRMGIVSCSFTGNAQGSYAVVGRTGVIEVPRAILPGLGTRIGETLIVIADGDGRRREEILPAVDHYQLMVEDFGDAVLTGSPVPLPPEDSINNMRVLDAIARSARLGRSETVQ